MVVFEEINLFRAHSTEATPSDVPFSALRDIQREVPGEDSRSYSILRLSYLQRRRGQTWVTKTFKTPQKLKRRKNKKEKCKLHNNQLSSGTKRCTPPPNSESEYKCHLLNSFLELKLKMGLSGGGIKSSRLPDKAFVPMQKKS